MLQILREKLLVASPGEAPGILAVAAHGDLPGVIRVAAARTALNLRRKDHRLDVGDDRLLRELCPDDNPELAALKAQHRGAFKAALEDALAGLTAQERKRCGCTCSTPCRSTPSAAPTRSTAPRRPAGSRPSARSLDRETRRLLRERQGLTDPEVDSLVRLVESRIEVSFRRVLGSALG